MVEAVADGAKAAGTVTFDDRGEHRVPARCLMEGAHRGADISLVRMNGSIGNNHIGVNLAFTKFLFVSPSADDDAARTRLRTAAGVIQRGFFNDFDAETRD